jgi:hypothetical protein
MFVKNKIIKKKNVYIFHTNQILIVIFLKNFNQEFLNISLQTKIRLKHIHLMTTFVIY